MNFRDKIKKLYNISKEEDCGFSEAKIVEAEKRLNIRFPATLRSYYLDLGANEKINQNHNTLIDLTKIDFTEDRHLVFFEENQSVVLWAVKEKDLTQENPQVFACYDNDQKEWFSESGTTEIFLLAQAYWNAALGGLAFTANADSKKVLTQETIALIEKNWKEQKETVNHFLRFFTNHHAQILILSIDHDQEVNGLYVAAESKKDFKAMMDILKIDWAYRSDQD